MRVVFVKLVRVTDKALQVALARDLPAMPRTLPVVNPTPDPMPEFVGTPRGDGRRFAVVASRFNETITRALADGAVDALVRHGTAFDDVDVVWVPGAWELPAAVRRVLASDRYAAVIAVGAVVRGDTPHFDIVAGEEAARIDPMTVARVRSMIQPAPAEEAVS